MGVVERKEAKRRSKMAERLSCRTWKKPEGSSKLKEGRCVRRPAGHNDSPWHPLHRKEGDEISMFWGPCLQSPISTLSFRFLALFFFAKQLALVSMITITPTFSLSVFSLQRTSISVPVESSGAPAESSGYTLRCSGDFTCGHFRGRPDEAEKPKNERSLRSATGRSITVPILASTFERALLRPFSVDFQTP